MRTPFLSVALTTLLAVSSSCSSAPKTVDQQPTAKATTSAPVAPAHDVSPVAAPAGLFATGSFASFEAAANLLQLGSDRTRAVESLLVGRPLRLRVDVDPARVAELVDPKAPASIAVAMQDGLNPGIAISLGLVDLEKGKSLFGAAEQISPGVFLARKGERQRAECAIAASAGATPARLVCALSKEALLLLTPYLARTVAATPPKNEGELEIDVARLDAVASAPISDALPKAVSLFKADYRTGDAAADAALDEGAKLVTAEALGLLKDLDKVKIVAATAPEGGVRVDASATFRGTTTLLARLATTTQNTAFLGPPAATPETSGTSGVRIEDPAMLADAIRLGKALLEGNLAKAAIGSPAERKRVAALLDFPLTKGMELVAISGSTPTASKGEPKTEPQKVAAALDAIFGYRIVRTNGSADAVARWLKDLVAAYNQPGIQKALKAATKTGLGLPSVKPIPAPKKLAKGALAYEVTFPKSDAKGSVSRTLYLVFAPGKQQSHLAIGADTAALVDRIGALGEGGKPLAEPPAALFVRTALLTGDMFVSGGSLFGSLKPNDKETPGDALLRVAKNMESTFDRLPHKGKSKVEVGVRTSPREVRVGVTIPRATFDDLNALRLREK